MIRWFKRRQSEIQGERVDLVYNTEYAPCERTSWVRSVYFSIYLHDRNMKVGECDLRLGMNEEIYYAGNVGYRIYSGYRGNGYAYEACLLLFELAKNQYHMSELIITCSPENIASRKTLEKLGGQLIGCEDVPEDHWLYQRGETVKNIYSFHL